MTMTRPLTSKDIREHGRPAEHLHQDSLYLMLPDESGHGMGGIYVTSPVLVRCEVDAPDYWVVRELDNNTVKIVNKNHVLVGTGRYSELRNYYEITRGYLNHFLIPDYREARDNYLKFSEAKGRILKELEELSG